MQRDIDKRVNTEGEAAEQVSWFNNCILTLKSHAGCQETDETNKIDTLEKVIEAGVLTTKPPTARVSEDCPNSFLRREYKVSGKLGEPGQTDKLTFVSLTHRIDSGIKRGYKEAEIVDSARFPYTVILKVM